jgi:hypothetical protein
MFKYNRNKNPIKINSTLPLEESLDERFASLKG